MPDNFTDKELEARILALQGVLECWIRSNDLWLDCGFKSYHEHYETEPAVEPIVLLLWADGPMHDVLNGNDARCDEFIDLVNDAGFHLEMYTSCVAAFYIWDDGPLKDAFRDYFKWLWFLESVRPMYIDLYGEVFEFFSAHPKRLYDLSARQFEEYLDGVFRNNGYRSELGPGGNDGGVDLRLYRHDVISESVTLVQAKRYKPELPIKLEAVQALWGAVTDENANRGLFVTTSRYLPSAEKFAGRQNRRIALATSSDVAEWSARAAGNAYPANADLITSERLADLLATGPQAGGLDGAIMHASTGVTMILNEFAIVVRSTKHAAVLVPLPTRKITSDGLEGTEIPNTDPTIAGELDLSLAFRARTKGSNLWGKEYLYSRWDGKPVSFSRLD